MKENLFIVVAYDIEDDRKRLRLHKTLKNFGTPVQKSVFECIMEEGQLRRMKEAVNRVIDEKKDRVRYYSLCQGCRRHIEATAGAFISQDLKTVVI